MTRAKSEPPLKPQKPVSSSKGQRKSIQGTQATPSPSSRKRHPAQLLSSEVPKDFQRIKDALFLHIQMMWGLFEQNSVPAKIDPSLSKEFYNRFNSIPDLKNATSDPQGPELNSQVDIISLRQGQAGRFKLGRGLANIDEMHILYVHAMLAKVGIRIWGPNLEESHDSLFNSACRITALNTSQQLLASGTYQYMNINLSHVNKVSLWVSAYNHYVHYVMESWFKKEMKELGEHKKDKSKKSIQKNQE